MSQSPEKRRCTLGNEPQNTSAKQGGFSFEAPKLNSPSAPRPGRQQNATGLTVPKAQDRARSWDGAKGTEPPKSPKQSRPAGTAQAKSASPVVPCREVKRAGSKAEG
ncbi:unnamed protein product, partial [Cladocopium goreaui]